jgi:hypothetical protein
MDDNEVDLIEELENAAAKANMILSDADGDEEATELVSRKKTSK